MGPEAPVGADRRYRVVPMSRDRQIMAAGLEVSRKRHLMYGLVEIDVSVPRRLLREHRERTGERLSFTAYVVACLARAVSEFPQLNAVGSRRKLYVLDDVNVVVLVERRPGGGEPVVEYASIRNADRKSFREIHDEIRAVQARGDEPAGAVTGLRWLRHVPMVLVRAGIRRAARSPRFAQRWGAVGVSNAGMGARRAGWGLAPGAGTVAVVLGGLVARPVLVDGAWVEHEHLCVSMALDHDIVDGAPAARFTDRFVSLLTDGSLLADV